MNVQLFYCEKLKARITLQQCETNRARPDIKDAGGEVSPHAVKFVEKSYRPSACNSCDDFATAKLEDFIPGSQTKEIKTSKKEENMSKKHSDELKAEIIECYKNGESVITLAQKFSVATSRIYVWLSDAGVPRNQGNSKAAKNTLPDVELNGVADEPDTVSEVETSSTEDAHTMTEFVTFGEMLPDAEHTAAPEVSEALPYILTPTCPDTLPDYAQEYARLTRINGELIKENMWLRKIASKMLRKGVRW